MTDVGPRRISTREVTIVLTGYFMPTHAPNVPVLMGMSGTDDLFMLVFSTEYDKKPQRPSDGEKR